jgi:hypothetical protein
MVQEFPSERGVGKRFIDMSPSKKGIWAAAQPPNAQF